MGQYRSTDLVCASLETYFVVSGSAYRLIKHQEDLSDILEEVNSGNDGIPFDLSQNLYTGEPAKTLFPWFFNEKLKASMDLATQSGI